MNGFAATNGNLVQGVIEEERKVGVFVHIAARKWTERRTEMNDLIDDLISYGWSKEEAEEMVEYLRDYNGQGKKALMDLISLYLAFKEIKNNG